MTVEPDGPGYEIQIEAQVAVMTSHRRNVVAARQKALPLLSNKTLLAWGGVPLGRAREQTVRLKNASNESVKLRLEVLSSRNEFRVSGPCHQPVSLCLVFHCHMLLFVLCEDIERLRRQRKVDAESRGAAQATRDAVSHCPVLAGRGRCGGGEASHPGRGDRAQVHGLFGSRSYDDSV